MSKPSTQVQDMLQWSKEEQRANYVLIDSTNNPVRFDDGMVVIYGDPTCDGDIQPEDTCITVEEYLRLAEKYPWFY